MTYLYFYLLAGAAWLALRIIGDFLQWVDRSISETSRLRKTSYAFSASYLLAGVIYLVAMAIVAWPFSVASHYRKWRAAK